MDYRIDNVRYVIEELRELVHEGELFSSLGLEVGAVLDSLTVVTRQPVDLPSPADEQGIWQAVDQFQQILDTDPTQITIAYLKALLPGLQSPDFELREQAVFSTLNEWLKEGLANEELQAWLFDYLLQDEILFTHIDEPHNQAIFGRSYAVRLLVSVLFAAKRQKVSYLNLERRERLVQQTAVYVAFEQDGRGYLEPQGWALAFTHISQLLDMITALDEIDRADKILLETILMERIKRLTDSLTMGELGNTARYLINLANLDSIYENYLLTQLKQWRPEMMCALQKNESRAVWVQHYNRSHLMGTIILQRTAPIAIHEYLEQISEFLA
ncbi:DUF2785 domain-containing protein [Weissella kandleri]|uniref:DUF2785 domain-containing protein n=1 Tax=Weissella kandleri TaxID=1616 RepID=UPI00387E4B93